MALTSAQIVTLACQEAKCPGYTSQAGPFLNSFLQDLCQNYDFDQALGTNSFSFTGSSGPYTLPADYLRTRVIDGKDEMFFVIDGVPYPLIQVTRSEYDWLAQTAGFSSYPQYYTTDLSTSPPGLYVWPPPSGSYAVTQRYQRLMPDITTPETSSTVPWFPNTLVLIRGVAGRLMGLTGDSRQADYLADGPEHPLGAQTLLNQFMKNMSDREGAPKTVGLDRRRFGRDWNRLSNTKLIGW